MPTPMSGRHNTWLTMGQVLCLPLMGVGLWLLLRPASR